MSCCSACPCKEKRSVGVLSIRQSCAKQSSEPPELKLADGGLTASSLPTRSSTIEALRQTKRIFDTTSSKTLNLSDTDPLHSTISQLVPWEMSRIQVTRAPIVRRLPRDIPYTHRGAALEFQDGSIEVESEPLDGMHFPRQRFKKAVAYGIFWFGIPDTTDQEAKPKIEPQPAQEGPEAKQPQAVPSSPISTVTFPGCPADVTNDTKAAIRRLHLNLGHPSEKELLRLLAWQGAISKQMITAVKSMQCASCNRAQKRAQPRPSSMSTAALGQFNDNLQSDVFYCRDVLGKNHAVVGIVDQSTLLHQAARLPDLTSATMTEIFRRVWFKPYGFPQCIRVDPGGTYAKDFRDFVERHGIFLEVIRAEAHWRIGLIERRNSVLRDILERVIDAEAVMSEADIDEALDSAVHALNSMSYSHGRPPYMAVFGQIPRVGSGLFQGDKALITKNEQYGSVRPDILRAEAMKAMIEVNASQALRRALLRKTATPHHNELLPGQSCAYWRWQNPRGRSTKKRGAWVVARFRAYDPDGRSAWLHSGTTTLQASLEQIRGAHGFEQWQPSGEDIKCLHDASTNIRTDMWQDHRATAPLQDEDDYDYQLHQTYSYEPIEVGYDLHHHRPQALQHQQSQHKLMWTQPSTHKQHHTTLLSTTSTSTHPHTSIQECRTPPPRGRTLDTDYNPNRFGLTKQARSRTPSNRALTAPRTPGLPAAERAPPRAPPVPQASSTSSSSTASSSTSTPHGIEQVQEPPVPHWPPLPPVPETPEAPEVIPVPPDTSPPTTVYDGTDNAATTQQAPAAPPQQAPQTDTEPTGSIMPTLPMKRPFEATLNDTHGRIEPPHWSWDGSPDTVITQTHSVLFAKAATKILQMEGYDVLETDLTTLQSESDAASSGPEDKIQPKSSPARKQRPSSGKFLGGRS